MKNSLAAVLIVVVLIVGVAVGWVGSMSIAPSTITSTQTTTLTPPVMPATSAVVRLDVIPDWGGAGYDAFVNPSYVNGTVPRPATSTTGPGPNDNNITVPAGVAVTFVITSIDTAVNQNFTGTASNDFTIYNDTASGYVALHYSTGEFVSRLPVGHNFEIPTLNVEIPIPPDTVVSFTHTFSSPGIYEYLCSVPCGPGMGLLGYMNGYIIVTSS